jgi:hypothetical protein
MTYTVNTHDCWDIVKVGNYQSIEEARTVFGDQCDDLRCKIDGTVKGVELVLGADAGAGYRLEWFAFR